MKTRFTAFVGTVRRIVGALAFLMFWVVVWFVFDLRGFLLCGLGFQFGLFMATRMANQVINDHCTNAPAHLPPASGGKVPPVVRASGGSDAT